MQLVSPVMNSRGDPLKNGKVNMKNARIIITEGETGIILKIESDVPISETEVEDFNKCQHFACGLIQLGNQANLWKVLNVEKIEGDITPKPPPGADIVDLKLSEMYNDYDPPEGDGPPKTAQI